jgi:uncharacterized membrane protein
MVVYIKGVKIFLVVFLIAWFTGFIGGIIGVLGYNVLRPEENRPKTYDYSHFGDDYADIVKVKYEGALQKNGDLIVSETLHFDVYSAYSPFREFYREFVSNPYDLETGAYVDFDTITVSEIKSGGVEPFERIPAPTYYDSRIEGTFSVAEADSSHPDELRWYVDVERGAPVYIVSYTYKNVLDVYSDSAVLDLMLWTGGSIDYIQEYDAVITFPDGAIDDDFGYFSHNQKQAEIAVYGNQLKLHVENPDGAVNLDYGFIDLRALTGQVALAAFTPAFVIDKTAYQEILQEEADWASEQKSFETKRTVTMILDIVIAVAVFAGGVILVRAARKKGRLKPVTGFRYFRDIPEAGLLLAVELVATKKPLKDNLLAGVVMSLCLKEYISLYKIDPGGEWSKNNIGITLMPKDDTRAAFSGYEATVMGYFRSLGLSLRNPIAICDVIKPSFAPHAEAFYKNFRFERQKARDNSGFFKKRKGVITHLHGITLFFGVVSAVALGLFSVCYTTTPYGFALLAPLSILWTSIIIGVGGLYGNLKDALTQQGENNAAECLGLYNFFNDLTTIEEADLPEIQKWEQYLVYAVAFGIGETVIKALQLRIPDSGSDGYLRHFGGNYVSVSHIGRAVQQGMSSAYSYGAPRSSSHSGSGFSGGGGSFGGGSSGGGGGGHGGGGGGGRH